MAVSTGDILFIRGHSIISDIVRYFDEGEYSHVAVALSPTHLIEAEWDTKSVIKPIEYSDYDVIKIDLSEDEKYKVISKAITLTGRWYDYPQLLRYIFDINTGTPNRLICSEIAYLLLKEAGIDLKDRNISPNMLYSKLHNTLMTRQQ